MVDKLKEKFLIIRDEFHMFFSNISLVKSWKQHTLGVFPA